jgi:quinol monooxygenase YgiN
MITVFASFYPKANQIDESKVKQILINMVEPTRNEKGNSKYDLFASKESSLNNSYHLLEIYDDQTAVDYHRSTEYYKNYRKEIINHLDRPIEVKILEKIR